MAKRAFELTVHLGTPTQRVLEMKRLLVQTGTTHAELFVALFRINCSGGQWVMVNAMGQDLSQSQRRVLASQKLYFHLANEVLQE